MGLKDDCLRDSEGVSGEVLGCGDFTPPCAELSY